MMKKILLAILFLGLFALASPALAKASDNPFWAAVIKLVQDILPGEEGPAIPAEPQEFDEEFVDPREVQQVQKEIKDQKRELNRIAKQAKKLTGGTEIVNEINVLLSQITVFENGINAGTAPRDTIQEFRDARIWEELNKVRARVEIPKEMTQWQKDIKKAEKLFSQKKYQSLGLNLGNAKTKLEETKAALARVQEYYNGGDFESAMEEFDNLRQDFHPGEIMSVMQRVEDLTRRLKSVKDAEVKSQVKETFSDAINNFNEGEYRVAREVMDESFNEITGLIYKATLVGKKKGVSKENFLQMTNQLEEKVKNKVEEKKENIQEIRERQEMQQQPQQPQQPQQIQPQQQPQIFQQPQPPQQQSGQQQPEQLAPIQNPLPPIIPESQTPPPTP